MPRMEIIVEMVGLAIDAALIAKISIVEIPRFPKTNVEGSASYLVDEVLVTSVNVVLSWIGAKIDWVLVLSLLVTINPTKSFFGLDVSSVFLGEWGSEDMTTTKIFFGLVFLVSWASVKSSSIASCPYSSSSSSILSKCVTSSLSISSSFSYSSSSSSLSLTLNTKSLSLSRRYMFFHVFVTFFTTCSMSCNNTSVESQSKIFFIFLQRFRYLLFIQTWHELP